MKAEQRNTHPTATRLFRSVFLSLVFMTGLAQAQVVRSEKLSSLGLLAAGVAHELNSPLTGILTFAHILGKRLPENAPEREHLEVILSQTNRCATIIRQLLDFSRETSTEKKPRDLHAVLQQAIAQIIREVGPQRPGHDPAASIVYRLVAGVLAPQAAILEIRQLADVREPQSNEVTR